MLVLTENGNASNAPKPKFIIKTPSMTLKVVKKPVSSSIAKDQKKEESKQEQDPKTSGMTTGLQSLCQNYESDESD